MNSIKLQFSTAENLLAMSPMELKALQHLAAGEIQQAVDSFDKVVLKDPKVDTVSRIFYRCVSFGYEGKDFTHRYGALAVGLRNERKSAISRSLKAIADRHPEFARHLNATKAPPPYSKLNKTEARACPSIPPDVLKDFNLLEIGPEFSNLRKNK